MSNRNKGFTLVELSIVIVIIGLIIAGVTAGQSLVKQGQLRSIATQADQVRSAVNAFKLQYNAFPGDITNGYSYWPSCGASTAVCNGDGDKLIETPLKNTNQQPETYIAWWELNAAGLFAGSYTIPASGSGAITGTIGTTIPTAKLLNAGITIGYDTNQLTGIALNKNIILFGAQASSNYAYTAILSAIQTSTLDAKFDDGKGNLGRIYGGASAATGTACQNAGVYATTNTITCTIGFSF